MSFSVGNGWDEEASRKPWNVFLLFSPSSPPFPNIQSNPSSLMSIFPIPVAGLRATEWARGQWFSNGRRQSPSRRRRSRTTAPRDSILKMTGIPLGPMNSRIAHWFLLATAETLFPQLTEACVRSSSLSSRGPWHTLISGVTHSLARGTEFLTPQARIDIAWGE